MPFSIAPLAALTVMLWILWSDSVRPRRPSKLVYWIRVALFLGVTVVIIYNAIRYPEQFRGGIGVFTWLAAIVGVLGAVHYVRKATGRAKPEEIEEHPLHLNDD